MLSFFLSKYLINFPFHTGSDSDLLRHSGPLHPRVEAERECCCYKRAEHSMGGFGRPRLDQHPVFTRNRDRRVTIGVIGQISQNDHTNFVGMSTWFGTPTRAHCRELDSRWPLLLKSRMDLAARLNLLHLHHQQKSVSSVCIIWLSNQDITQTIKIRMIS